MRQIFPRDVLENTTELHQFKHSTKSKIIYFIILSALIGTFISLPFLRVDVNSSARGIIKPNKERVILNIITSGRIIYSKSINNQSVEKGDTLLVIENNGIDDRLRLLDYRLKETKLFIEDLTVLLRGQRVQSNELKSSNYQRTLLQYSHKLSELHTRHRRTKRVFNRHQILFNKGVISKSEFENIQFDFNLVTSDIYQFKKKQQSSWQADLTQYQNQFRDLKSSKDQLIKSKSKFVITAPANGTLLNLQPQELGGFISAGTRFGEISPDTDLVVECFIKPSDIGLLTENTKIKFQIDAYNYNQWGLASGQIVEIGKDIELVNNQPIVKVRCIMNEKFLMLNNGFRGNIKKGMTLTANFVLKERSLYNLLYDKMDDWVNPSRKDLAIQ